jgi:hypothetical protein
MELYILIRDKGKMKGEWIPNKEIIGVYTSLEKVEQTQLDIELCGYDSLEHKEKVFEEYRIKLKEIDKEEEKIVQEYHYKLRKDWLDALKLSKNDKELYLLALNYSFYTNLNDKEYETILKAKQYESEMYNTHVKLKLRAMYPETPVGYNEVFNFEIVKQKIQN